MSAVATKLPLNSMKSVKKKQRIMNASRSTRTLHECCFFICLPQPTIAQVSRSKRWVCEILRSPSITVTDASSPINCSAPTDSTHEPCALLARYSTTQTWVCTWTHPLHATSFALQGPCFIQLPSFQILTCNPSPMNFPAMMTSCTLSSPACGVRGPRGPKLPSAPRSAGHCSSIMDAVFIPTCGCTVVRLCVC